MSIRAAEVLIPLPLDQTFTYVIPDGLAVEPGDFVSVPWGPIHRTGLVATISDIDPGKRKLKGIEKVKDWPRVSLSRVNLALKCADYTLSPLGSVARHLFPPRDFDQPVRHKVYYEAVTPLPEIGRVTPARQKLLDCLHDDLLPQTVAELAALADVSEAVVRGLIDKGALQKVLPDETPGPRQLPLLTAEQETALAQISEKEFAVTLLNGITGSGKTEVYFHAIARALDAGQSALILIPEIALTASWLNRFRDTFGFEPVIWHSGRGQRDRRLAWRQLAAGEQAVVVGPRSSLWLPYGDLGLIVVDEEHDGSYKQEEGVTYNARDMAIWRAQLENCPILLASATPSLESEHNVKRGRFKAARLTQRFGQAQLPEMGVIDMRTDPPERNRWIAPSAVKAIEENMASGGQSLLFLNRRGYAPLTLCRSCGERVNCPDCASWLVEHRLQGRLTCHHCGFNVKNDIDCPSCEEEGALVPCGPGVERLYEEVSATFPDADIRIASSDTLADTEALDQFLAEAESGAIDIIIGTQVMAKGQHFPDLSLVVAVDADLRLAGGDPRAAEKTFQLMSQVAGRAGREERPGKVLLQTYQPEDETLAAIVAQDREMFLEQELGRREEAGLPPFGRLASVIISDTDPRRLDDFCQALARNRPQSQGGADGFDIFGPAPAPIALLRGRHRRRFLVRSGRQVHIQKLLRAWLSTVKPGGKIRLTVDIDPYTFM